MQTPVGLMCYHANACGLDVLSCKHPDKVLFHKCAPERLCSQRLLLSCKRLLCHVLFHKCALESRCSQKLLLKNGAFES